MHMLITHNKRKFNLNVILCWACSKKLICRASEQIISVGRDYNVSFQIPERVMVFQLPILLVMLLHQSNVLVEPLELKVGRKLGDLRSNVNRRFYSL